MTHSTHRLSTHLIHLFNDLFFMSTRDKYQKGDNIGNHGDKPRWGLQVSVEVLISHLTKTLTPFPAHSLPLSLLGQLLEGSWSNGVHWLATQICGKFCKDGSFYKLTVTLVVCEQVFFSKSLSAFDKLYNNYSEVYGNICQVFPGQDSYSKPFVSWDLPRKLFHPSHTNKSKLTKKLFFKYKTCSAFETNP